MSRATVSIAMPTYNRASLLPQSIGAILAQDYTDFELLVIDDGSTDNTAEVIANFNDSRIRYIPLPENRGIGNARATGVTESQGDFLALADSDDIWFPNKLAHQVKLLQEHPEIDLAFGDFLNINHITDTSDRGFDQMQASMALLKTKPLSGTDYLITDGILEVFIQSSVIHPPTITFRPSVIEKAGNFNLNLRRASEFEFCWRAALNNTTFAYTTEILAERHKYESSVTANPSVFAPKLVESLELCRQQSQAANQQDIVRKLTQRQHQLYCSVIHEYAVSGKRSQAIAAFWKTLRYGFSFRAVMFLMAALLGPKAITFAKNLRSKT